MADRSPARVQVTRSLPGQFSLVAIPE